ncbi:hypothetical protein ACI5KX_12225 [Erythrobacter sp. GH1-10]|uniref:hypothetical protein n=1 Tax=Erythrobacter sp. GH1-10 TaxID=3349334 RepID=UPI0038782BF8
MAAASAWRIDATQAATLVNNCIFGTDTVTFWRWLLEGNYLGLGVHKHTLSVILTAVIAHPLVWLGMSNATAVALGMAAVWGGVAAVSFVYFRQAGLTKWASLAFTVLAMSAFGTATHSGIAETYGATLLMIGVAVLLLPVIAQIAERYMIASATMAGGIGAGLALANAPSIAFLLIYYACLAPVWKRGKAGKLVFVAVAIPFAMVSLAVISPAIAAEGLAGTSWHNDYLGRYSDLANFTDAATIKDYLASAFVFSFVAPLDYLQCRYVASELAGMISRPFALMAYLTTVSLVATGIFRALKGSRRPEALGLLGAVASILLFYLYFNPDEALLYSPQWLAALFFAAAPSFRGAAIWAGVGATLCLSVNIAPLHHPRTSNPEACCPNPPASMLPREYPSALEKFRADNEMPR